MLLDNQEPLSPLLGSTTASPGSLALEPRDVLERKKAELEAQVGSQQRNSSGHDTAHVTGGAVSLSLTTAASRLFSRQAE